MSELTVNLRKWADELDSGRHKQGTILYAYAGRACVEGVAILSLGFSAARVTRMSEDEVGQHLHGFGVARISKAQTEIERRICGEVARIKGRSVFAYASLTRLNDTERVDFLTFARAIRTVARQLEEEEFGAPIVTSEPARELVEAS